MVADAILTLEQPFPGDDLFEVSRMRPELRFNVIRQRETCDYVIHDHLDDTRLLITRDLLSRPKFDLSRWYATRRAQALNLSPVLTHHSEMGYPISLIASKLLTDGISSSYPGSNVDLDPDNRFEVYPSRFQPNTVIISDADVQNMVYIPLSLLEDPTFDLVSWYRQRMNREDLFNEQHFDTHLRRYCSRSGAHVPRRECPHRLPATARSRPSTMDEHVDGQSPKQARYFFETEPVGEGMPDLVSVSDDEEEACPEEGANDLSHPPEPDNLQGNIHQQEEGICELIIATLTRCQPYPGDERCEGPIDPSYVRGSLHFVVESQSRNLYCVYDRVRGFEAYLHATVLQWRFFSLGKWFAELCA